MSNGKPFQKPNRKWLKGSVILGIAFLLFSAWTLASGRSKSVAGKTGQAIAEGEVLAKAPEETWNFAVSGDSRNCGDVVMPAIAAGVQTHQAVFYWHLGDFRLGSDVDQDMAQEEGYRQHHISISRYEDGNWTDFIQNQLLPFGNMPVFLALGNHELHFKTEEDYLVEFATWLNTPIIRRQRIEDSPADYGLRTYYHWMVGGIDFFSLDNAAADQFDEKQVRWFESVLKRDEADPSVHTIVLGMHRALPHSVAQHSMDESAMGVESGTRVYQDLLKAEQESHKHVYVLCAHLHLYMANIFNTDYWKAHGGVLPGWIVATAGATRAALPADSYEASDAMTNVYGYLVGTVNPSGSSEGEISFKYYQVKESDVPPAVVDKFTPDLVNWCFEENREGGSSAAGEK